MSDWRVGPLSTETPEAEHDIDKGLRRQCPLNRPIWLEASAVRPRWTGIAIVIGLLLVALVLAGVYR